MWPCTPTLTGAKIPETSRWAGGKTLKANGPTCGPIRARLLVALAGDEPPRAGRGSLPLAHAPCPLPVHGYGCGCLWGWEDMPKSGQGLLRRVSGVLSSGNRSFLDASGLRGRVGSVVCTDSALPLTPQRLYMLLTGRGTHWELAPCAAAASCST